MIQHTDGLKLQVDVVGLDVTVLIGYAKGCRVKFGLFCSRDSKIELPSGNLSAGRGISVGDASSRAYLCQVIKVSRGAALLELAPDTDTCAFGCLRLHSVLASSSCRLNTSGHFGSRHKLLAALPKLTN